MNIKTIAIAGLVLLGCVGIIAISCDNNNVENVSVCEQNTGTIGQYIHTTDLTVEGETHRYIYYSNGKTFSMTHFPDCPYPHKKNNAVVDTLAYDNPAEGNPIDCD